MSDERQQSVWRDSLAALESLGRESRAFALELEVRDLPDGVIPVNSEGRPCIYAHAWDTDDEKAVRRQVVLDDPSGWCDVLIRKALTEEGHRIWHRSAKPYLEQLPIDIVSRIARAIMLGSPDAEVADDGS